MSGPAKVESLAPPPPAPPPPAPSSTWRPPVRAPHATVAIAVVVLLLGVYIPLSPVAQERDAVDKAVQQRSTLNTEVQQLQVYRQRYGELKQQMDALSKQLDTLKTIVPEEKETDEFIRLIQGAAGASNVQIRRLTSLV